jgi:hypothetical protein
LERIGLYIASTLFVVFGAVMLTQWVYDPAQASAPFKMLGVSLLATGVYSGAQLVKNNW